MKFRSLLFPIVVLFVSMICRAKVLEINDIWDIEYNKRPMVIDAYASWCAPCRIYSPIFERLAREYDGIADFYRVNIDNPDAEDFVIRYEINSVPTTVFLWDPLGDACVKSNVERGMMSYDELKFNIEQTIKKQYRFEAAKLMQSELEWDRFSPHEFCVYKDYDADFLRFEGEWIGTENGCESRFWVTRKGNEIQIFGGTLDSGRQQLVDTVYWILLGADLVDNEQVLCLSDVLPLAPTSPSDIAGTGKGMLSIRTFKASGDNLIMSVEEYAVRDNHADSSPSKTYTVTYTKV